MYGVTFGYKHSYDDLGLILTERDVSLPEPNRFTVDVPGTNGKIDVTESLTPNITYKNRKVTYTFKVKGGPEAWDDILRDVAGYLHGMNLKAWEDADEDWFWEGFWTVDKFSSSKSIGTIVIKGDVFPYKLKDEITEEEIELNGEEDINLTNSRMPAMPTIETNGEITVEFGTFSATLSAGVHILADILLTEGDNILTLSGNADVTITYQEGAL